MTESTFEPWLTQCEKEPLASSGLIQDEGVLLHIDHGTGVISYVSANSATFLGDGPEDLLGTDGHAWIRDFLPDLSGLPRGAGTRILLPQALDLGLGELNALISATASGWLIELEPSREPLVDPASLRLAPRADPVDAAALAAAQQDLVDRIAEATGYDRVMLYEFKADWSGEVLAEHVTRSKGTYLGLRFPASDIPAIARALYAQTPYRHIPDVEREPVALLAAAGAASALDLTWSDLRSVSPVHREYLHNMHVAASFSVSVILDGKLWGLVACHNPEPLRVPAAARGRCQELVAELVSTLVSHRRRIQTEQMERLDEAVRSIPEMADGPEAISDGLAGHLAGLARLLDAPVAAVVVEDRIARYGALADDQIVRRAHDWCLTSQSETIAAVERLPDEIRESGRGSGTDLCGVLSIALRAKRHGNRLVSFYFFRPEESMEIAWAGNPEKPVEVTQGSVKLSPRNSFEKWVEVRTGFARPWDEIALFTAGQLQRRLETIL